MNNLASIQRLDLECLQPSALRDAIVSLERPLILTKGDRGVAAILPYTDPRDLKSKRRSEK